MDNKEEDDKMDSPSYCDNQFMKGIQMLIVYHKLFFSTVRFVLLIQIAF